MLDLSYAINDKLVPWPGDTRWFEAQVNATVEKNGYFTRSFWMLEHYGTHLDAPIHFPPGKVDRRSNSHETIVWAGRCRWMCAARGSQGCRLPASGGARGRMGEAARADS